VAVDSPELTHHPAIALLVELIKRPSVTPQDAGCQDVIAKRLTKAGFHCEAMPFGDVRNLWARLGERSPLLCFAGHTDVVPPGDLSDWASDPFSANFRDGLLFGRGAADMKGGLAAMVVAAEQFVATCPEFSGSLAFLITSDEEGVAADGTRKVIETLTARNEKIDWCVVGEPSSDKQLGDTIRIGRRGSLTGSLNIRGIQGHVAYADLAQNPIREFSPALAELLNTEWDQGNADFPPTGFEVVHIDSSSGADNVIPGRLNLRFNFRYSTEWNHNDLRQKVRDILERHQLGFELDWHLSGEPFLTTQGELTNAAGSAILEIANVETTFSTGGGTSDGRFISPAGTDVIELGLINASIHKVNEHVRTDDVADLCEMYQRIMQKLLAGE